MQFTWREQLRLEIKPATCWSQARRPTIASPLHPCSSVFTFIGALGTPSRTGPLARKYLPGFPYSWSLRRLRQKISSIYCQLGAPQKEKKSGALTTCRVCPLVKTVLHPWPIHMQKINVKGQTVQKLEQKQSKRTRLNLLSPSLMRSVNNTYCTQIWKISPLLVFTMTWLILNRFW